MIDRGLSSATAIENGNVITVSGGSLTLTDTSAAGTGKITGGNNSSGAGGIDVAGTLVMEGGTILDCTVEGTDTGTVGGGVRIQGGVFNFTGGAIKGNYAEWGGGGVGVTSGGEFNMSGDAKILKNSTGRYGGGVFVEDGTFNMSGGIIGSEDSSLGNSALQGGGVRILGTFNMSGNALITGNSGGGVVNTGTFTLSGSPKITGNTLSDGTTANNVYLPGGNTISIGGAGLDNGASIGVRTSTAPTADSRVQITDVAVENYFDIFTADNNDYAIAGRGNSVQLAVKEATIQKTSEQSARNAVFEEAVAMANESTESTTIQLLTDIQNTHTAFSSDGGTTQNNQPIKFTGTGSVTLDLNGHTIDRGLSSDSAQENGNVITVSNGAELTIKDGSDAGTGTITGGKNSSGAGGIYVAGTLVMSGGTIGGNYGTLGGGVFVGATGTFEMSGGTIGDESDSSAGNMATMKGGGIFVSVGTLKMSGDASVKNNIATTGGGVFAGGSIEVSGSITITKNTNDASAANNVYLPDGKTITVGGTLDSTARIGITTETTPMPGVVVQITTADVTDAATIFSSDKGVDSGYTLENRYIAGESSQAVHHVYSDMVKVMDSAVTVTGALHPDVDSSASAVYKGVFIEGRTVTLSPFYMAKYPVTKAQYKAIMSDTSLNTQDFAEDPSYSTSDPTTYVIAAGENDDNRPVEGVTWYDAVYFCNLLSKSEGLDEVYSISGITPAISPSGNIIKSATVTMDMTKNGYRLPTEAEWEIAARGGDPNDTTNWNYLFSGAATASGVAYNENQNSGLDDVGWYYYNICNGGTTTTTSPSEGTAGYGTHEVGLKAPNALGIYDMSGNVMEWCWDWYNDTVDTGTATTPTGPSSGSYRVMRGGCWNGGARFCSVAFRSNTIPSGRNAILGFRLVRNAPAQ